MAERPLTQAERRSILERDEYTSQMRHYSEKRGFYKGCAECPLKGKSKPKLQVHHVNPNGNGGANEPENLITVNECEHVGKRCDGTLVYDSSSFVIHEDMRQGFEEYRKGDKKAIQRVMERRKPLKENGEVYWNTDHDAEMAQTAVERTQNAISLGWIFKRKKK